GGVAQHADHRRGGGRRRRPPAPVLADRLAARGGVPRHWANAHGPHRTRRGARARGDLLPLPVLQPPLRGSDDLGAPGPGCTWNAARRASRRAGVAGGGAGGGAGLIEHWRRAVVLAPHTDDGEFGCGGTMARLVELGCEVRYVAFSIATRSLPEGFPPDTLAREVREATAELGIPEERLTVHDFDVRTFPEHRQEILE